VVDIIAPHLGTIMAEDNTFVPVKHSLFTAASVLYDAVYIPGGLNSCATLAADPDAIHFINEAYRHCKPIAADQDAIQVIEATYFSKKPRPDGSDEDAMEQGVAISNDITQLVRQFSANISLHRFWDQEKSRKIPA
jgi:catalase